MTGTTLLEAMGKSQIETMTVFRFITFCWIAFVVYWWVSAWNVKKTVKPSTLSSRLRHKVWLWLAIFLLVGAIPFYPLQILVVPHSRATGLAGCAVCLLGLGITIWARRTLARNWNVDVVFKEDHELITHGPYRYARHPIYTGLLTMFLGTAVARGRIDGFLAVVFCLLSFWIKLKQEEKLMLQHFPDSYPDYKQRVKALVPFVL